MNESLLPPILLVRVDTRHATGMGHLYRCLALAELALLEGWRVEFAVERLVDSVAQQYPQTHWQIVQETSEANDAETCLNHLQTRASQAALVMVDHYQLASEWETVFHETEIAVVAFDDLCRNHHANTRVIDTNPQHSTSDYPGLSKAAGLFGLAYFPLRRALRQLAQMDDSSRDTLLVFLSSSPQKDLLEKILSILPALKFPENVKRIVVLSSTPVQLEVSEMTMKVEIHSHVLNMAEMYARTFMCLGSAGVSLWERLALNIPSVIWQVADNQADNIAWLKQHTSMPILSGDFNDTELTLAMAKAVNEFNTPMVNGVDAFGALRIWRTVCPEQHRVGEMLEVKEYSQGYVQPLLALQSIPGIRRWSRNSNPPSAEEHQHWSTQLLASRTMKGWCFLIRGQLIGWLKLEQDSDNFHEVSLLVHPDMQGMGMGSRMLEFAKQRCSMIKAYVKPENVASVQLFLKSSFNQQGDWFYWQEKG